MDPHHVEAGKAREAFRAVTRDIAWVAEAPRPHKAWLAALGVALIMLAGGIYSIYVLVTTGIGVWGNSNTVCWAWDITNFVWWIGIGHAGTLISSVLYLTRQTWRVSINRSAEAMTIFAVMCAGLFPLLHTGRPWFAWWMIPHPNDMQMWPQFRSPLIWDVFAVSTYATVSAMFWFVGLIPDLATLRDRSKSKPWKVIYGILAMGWRGSARHWHNYEIASLLLAGLATPLVVSVHTVVSFDFAVGQLPGWHATIFPPYFVAGAIYSGFAMVMTLAIPMRAAFGLEGFITTRHIHNMTKIMLVTGMIVAYGYLSEVFFGWFSGNEYEKYVTFNNRMAGHYAGTFWMLIVCNVAIPQMLWFRGIRTNPMILWCITIVINVGMWLERFVIVITSLHADYLPSSWDMYYPTIWDWATYVGTIGFFLFCFLLFIRFLPAISIFEMRELVAETSEKHDATPAH
jgi:molybdopterin-containing oxidoreductase family membrane subunit